MCAHTLKQTLTFSLLLICRVRCWREKCQASLSPTSVWPHRRSAQVTATRLSGVRLSLRAHTNTHTCTEEWFLGSGVRCCQDMVSGQHRKEERRAERGLCPVFETFLRRQNTHTTFVDQALQSLCFFLIDCVLICCPSLGHVLSNYTLTEFF